MKMILVITALLVVLGCSSNWSTNPGEQEDVTNATVQLTDEGAWTDPVNDIEPQEPECISESYGYLELRNPCGSPVSCRMDQGVPCLIFAGDDFTMQAGHGYHTLYWSGVNGVYEESIYVPLCKTAEVTFEQDEAQKLSVHK